MLTPKLQAKAREIAHRRIQNELIQKLRAKRLGAAVPPPATKKEPDEDDLGGYDALEQMFHAGGDGSGR